jgi:hypothetical protein
MYRVLTSCIKLDERHIRVGIHLAQILSFGQFAKIVFTHQNIEIIDESLIEFDKRQMM